MKDILRMCIVCKQMKDKKQLIRIVKNENILLVEKSKKIDGRGAYVCKEENCLASLKKTKALNRAFKVNIGDQDYDKIIGEIIESKNK